MKMDLGVVHTNADAELTEPYEKLPTINFDVSTGTTGGEMDLMWHDQRTLAASATEELDLADGSLLNAFGEACAFTDVRLICIQASEDNTNDVLVGGTVTHEWLGWLTAAGDIMTVPAGAATMNYSPKDGTWAVTSGSSDTLQIANGAAGSSVTYDIYIGGTSA